MECLFCCFVHGGELQADMEIILCKAFKMNHACLALYRVCRMVRLLQFEMYFERNTR